jgi:hypothetical protein
MDVLTGGGLGDLCRKLFLGDAQIKVDNSFLKSLGARRLLYNPVRVKKNSNNQSLSRTELSQDD